MAFGSTPVTTGTPVGTPLGSVAVPNHAGGNLTALEGGPASTDSNGNETAPASVYSKDGGNVTMGAVADAAWSGSGNGTLVAILKKIVAGQSGTATIVNGATSSLPLLTEQNIQSFIRAGQGYTVTTGSVNASGAGNFQLSIFNPSTSGKSILIYRVKFYNSTVNSGHKIIFGVTTDPAFATSLTPVNQLAGGAASAINTKVTTNGTTTQAVPGTGSQVDTFTGLAAVPYEIVDTRNAFVLPAGSAFGLDIVLIFGAAATYAMTANWIEF
jgi:hypothetical protein